MSTTPPTHVAFVDDHTLVRTGLVGLVNRLGGYRVVLEADDGREFTKALPKGPNIDIAIVDLNMPIMDGYATIAWLHKHHPHIKALALTFDASESAAIRAVHVGARGFLLKNVKPATFKEALDSVRDTGYYGSGDGTAVRDAGPSSTERYERQRQKILDSITERELEIIKLACAPQEYTYEEIGQLLNIKPSTIEAHRKNIFDRFHIKSKAGLVIFAYRWGIVQVVRE